jgi:hypothetical protein
MPTHRLRQPWTDKDTPVHSGECTALRAETRWVGVTFVLVDGAVRLR